MSGVKVLSGPGDGDAKRAEHQARMARRLAGSGSAGSGNLDGGRPDSNYEFSETVDAGGV